jgi:acetolactate synthase-1/2/3 large subunit
MRTVRAASPFDVPGYAVDDGYPIAPHRAIADLEQAAGPDARFISDIGEHMLFALHYLTARTPSAFHIQLNLGSMGSGIAGAIGLAVADPTRRVVCICGDGGMQMSGMELLVALRDRLPIVYAVFNDGRYNMVHHGMKQIFGGAAAWETPMVDFAAWAGSFGVPSARIDAPGDINAARLDRLTAHGGPALLDIRIDRDLRIRGGGRVEALQHMSMLQSGAGE